MVGYVTQVRGGLIAVGATLLTLLVPATAGAQQPAPAVGLPAPSTPDLIDRAQEAGRIDNERANLYRVYALKNDSRLPAAYESDTPFDGTVELLKARREVRLMEAGPERSAVTAALRAPPDPNITNCDALSVAALPDSTETEHFYIQYDDLALESSLEIEDYEASLEQAWLTEIDSFNWADPPTTQLAEDEIDGKYHVRIDALGPGLYGFVSSVGTYAGEAENGPFPGDNPNTSWDDLDADASCMGLNQDYTGFPSPPQESLDSTTGHEFNHSLQFGYGALSGTVPDDSFIEGGATWMEDEVFDDANDNWNYLYPDFDSSMGEHEGDIYAYWLTFRGLTERFGANTPGGAEQVMQDFWEIVSREEGSLLAPLQEALAAKGRTLPETFHDYAVAAKLMRPCGGVYFRPYCFEEATGYTSEGRGVPAAHGNIAAAGSSYPGSIEDNYTINWVTLPSSGSYNVTLSMGATGGGQLRGTIACDTAAGVALAPFPAFVGPSSSQTVPGFDRSSCTGTPVAVITNQSQTADNPSSSAARAYSVSTAAASAQTAPVVPERPAEEPPDNGPGPGGETPGGSTGGQPPTGGGNTTIVDTVRPLLTGVGLSSRRFRAARAGRAISSAPRGMRVRYRLSEAATVSVRYERRVSGRRVGGRCRAVTRRNRGRQKCLRWVLVPGAGRRGGRAGANSFRLSGRMNGLTLRRGVYRLRLSARDAARNTSNPRRSPRFRIVRR